MAEGEGPKPWSCLSSRPRRQDELVRYQHDCYRGQEDPEREQTQKQPRTQERGREQDLNQAGGLLAPVIVSVLMGIEVMLACEQDLLANAELKEPTSNAQT